MPLAIFIHKAFVMKDLWISLSKMIQMIMVKANLSFQECPKKDHFYNRRHLDIGLCYKIRI